MLGRVQLQVLVAHEGLHLLGGRPTVHLKISLHRIHLLADKASLLLNSLLYLIKLPEENIVLEDKSGCKMNLSSPSDWDFLNMVNWSRPCFWFSSIAKP